MLYARCGEFTYPVHQFIGLTRQHTSAMNRSRRTLPCLQHARIDPHRDCRRHCAAASLAKPRNFSATGADLFHWTVDGMPSGAERSGTAYRRGTVTADPDRRVWLLSRFGFEVNITELRVL